VGSVRSVGSPSTPRDKGKHGEGASRRRLPGPGVGRLTCFNNYFWALHSALWPAYQLAFWHSREQYRASSTARTGTPCRSAASCHPGPGPRPTRRRAVGEGGAAEEEGPAAAGRSGTMTTLPWYSTPSMSWWLTRVAVILAVESSVASPFLVRS